MARACYAVFDRPDDGHAGVIISTTSTSRGSTLGRAVAGARAWLGTPQGHLFRRVAGFLLVASIVGIAIYLAPGLFERLGDGDPGWLVFAGLFEVGSCLGFVLLFRAVFRGADGSPDRTLTFEVASTGLGASALMPSAGVAGTAAGAWAFRKAGMSGARVARNSVAFLILQNAAFVVGTAIIGLGALLNLIPTKAPLGLLLSSAVLSWILMVAVLIMAASAGAAAAACTEEGRLRRWYALLAIGARDSVWLLRRPLAVIGAAAYAACDFGALWAAFRAFDETPSLGVLLLGYLLGQSASSIPVPAGVGAVDAGMIGALVALGMSADGAAAGVLSYRALALSIPAAWGGIAYLFLRRRLRRSAGAAARATPARSRRAS